MGLFDLPAPILSWLDNLLSGVLPDLLRLIIWSVIAVALGFFLYQRLAVTSAIKADNASKSHAILPLVISVLPIIYMATWLNNTYEYEQPIPGAPVKMEMISTVSAVTAGKKTPPKPRTDKFEKAWPLPEGRLIFRDIAEPVGSSINASPAQPSVTKKNWRNAFFGNPVGYIPRDFAIQEIKFDVRPRKMISVNSYWVSNWKLWFILSLIASYALLRWSFRDEAAPSD